MYDSPHQFEPTSLSDRQLDIILPLAEKIVLSSSALRSAAHDTTRATLRALVDRLLVSDSVYGPVRFGLPLDALNMLFPNLYPEANLPID